MTGPDTTDIDDARALLEQLTDDLVTNESAREKAATKLFESIRSLAGVPGVRFAPENDGRRELTMWLKLPNDREIQINFEYRRTNKPDELFHVQISGKAPVLIPLKYDTVSKGFISTTDLGDARGTQRVLGGAASCMRIAALQVQIELKRIASGKFL